MNGKNTLDVDAVEEFVVQEMKQTPDPKAAMTEHEAAEANAALVEHMGQVLQNSLCAAVELRHKLRHSYWIVVVLSLVMFTLGMVLISTPVWAPLVNTQFVGTGPFEMENILTTVGVGVADLIALFLFGPITRIQRLMGKFSQLTVGLETYQMLVAIRLIEADSNDRPTLGAAATHVAAASLAVLDAIEKYYAADLSAQANPITPPKADA